QFSGHLRAWLGDWPGTGEPVVTVAELRDRPRWDGGAWPLLGVGNRAGAVLSVSPALAADLGAEMLDEVAGVLRLDDGAAVPAEAVPGGIERLVLRWTAAPAELPEIGEWVSPGDPRVPAWLRPFNGDVLVAWDDEGRYAAGVGRKRHNALAQEISVGTEPAQRGKGLAPALVAQAARRILAEGALPLYLHALDNMASARVADKAGFRDRGWRAVWVE
ncbi:MAG: GNAT family N-acetyltransferase, partial [Thermomicrobiales bacterium]|nr:GNAT family N-acetyltransferase [Thermomicrobiales bacterium]